ncbi:MAG: phosphatase PAP2 family protein [Rhodospirillales bacterium]|nr:phosphatase PAP2 family protein [Rhodospirillales bacterium]
MTTPLRHRLKPAARRLWLWSRDWPLLASFVVVLVFCAIAMLAIDRPLALALKAHVGPQLEGFFKTITVLGDASGYIVVGLVAMLVLRALANLSVSEEHFTRYRRLGRVALFFLAAMLGSGALVSVLKFSIGRLRPRYLFESGLYGFQPFNAEWAMNSFPSGHSQAIFAAMTALYFIYPRYDVAYFALAILIAMSRVVTSVHYLSDTVMGAWLAVAVVILIRRLFWARGIDVQVKLARDRQLV